MDYQNCDGFIGAIIAEGKATLKELKYDYTLEEAFIIWEIIMVNRHNEQLALDHAKKKGGK